MVLWERRHFPPSFIYRIEEVERDAKLQPTQPLATFREAGLDIYHFLYSVYIKEGKW